MAAHERLTDFGMAPLVVALAVALIDHVWVATFDGVDVSVSVFEPAHEVVVGAALGARGAFAGAVDPVEPVTE
ncbi:MAG: hypothetical protein NVSMB48_14810 [Marmoricola sp.]